MSDPLSLEPKVTRVATITNSKRLSTEETMDLWSEYKRTGNPRLRDRLVLTFAPMVKYIVYRKAREIPARCEVDDFISCGLEALIRSIDRYDPEKGATLERYAWTRIHGAVLDELRRNDWAPRSLRRWDRDLTKTRDDFIRLEGCRPTNLELADAMGDPGGAPPAVAQIARAQVGLADMPSSWPRTTPRSRRSTRCPPTIVTATPSCRPLRGHAKERLRAALETLPERERKLAVLLYVHNLTLREIGEIPGVTESCVCQIHGNVLRKLQTKLDAHEQLFVAATAAVAVRGRPGRRITV